MNPNTLARTFANILRLIIIAALAAGLTLSVSPAPVAFASTFVVTKTEDTNDGTCDSDCSLREAIAAANAAPDADDITVPAGTYNLTLGTLSIANPLTLNGALSSTTIINATPNTAVFSIGSAATAALENVTIQGGFSPYAGGINNSGTLTLDDTIVTHNTGVLGAGIYNWGKLMISHSAIVGNTTGLAFGGGIYNSGTLTVTESLIAENTAGNGGGLFNYGTALILTSTIRDNTGYTAYSGGAIHNRGTITLTATSLYGNRALDFGGGLQNMSGRVWLNQSNVMYNTALRGGGAGNDYGQMMVRASTFAGNIGGGLYNRDALTLTNTTIHNNFLSPSTFPYNLIYGSGLYNIGLTSTANINNVTLTGNWGHGIYQTNGAVNLKNTILAGNLAGDCVGTLNSQDYNLIQGALCTITGTTVHNITATSPLLGFMQDNGGATPTQPLLTGSPALESGNPALPGSGGDACEATDQREVPRPQGGFCDIGASEGGYDMPPDVTFSLDSSVDPWGLGMTLSNTVAVGQLLTYTVVVTNIGGSIATGVRLTDTLPTDELLASVMASQGSCGASGRVVTCGPVSLNSNAVLIVTIAVTPTKVNLHLNTVRVTSDATGPTTVNITRVEPTSVSLLARDTLVSFPIVTTGAVAWADYDSDGDLDVLITGNTGSERIAQIYRNDGNHTYTAIAAGLTGVDYGAVAWGDYDNDTDLDLLVTGYTGSAPFTGLYRNNGDGSFTAIAAGLVNVQKGAVAWGDYDLDGDLDVVLTGQSGSGPVTRVYRNEGGGTFTDLNATLPGVSDSDVAWGDYDNDGDLDLALMGNTGSSRTAKIYRNGGGGVFADSGASFYGIERGTAAWGDHDTDGDLDLLLTGYDGCGAPQCGAIYLYRNDSGAFALASLLGSTDDNTAAWGDYDNDGNLDIAHGTNDGLGAAVYQNLGNHIFADARANLHLTATAWGDDDNDGDLDILAPGYDYPVSPPTTIYRNHALAPNTPPTTPTGLSVTISGTTAFFSWSAASDAQTPPSGLTYNLRVGTTPGGSDVVSPMAASTGYRRLPAMGNVGQGLTATVQNLSPGVTYDWSVQAIDTAFAGSPFAAEGSFITPPPPTVQFSSDSFSVDENSIMATITATLSAASELTITTNFTTSNGTALAGGDYLTATGILTFTPGTITQTISVPIINDLLDETDDTIMLTLGNPTNAALGTPNPATLTIMDDDPPPAAQFSTATQMMLEMVGTVTMTVNVSATSGLTVSVPYSVSGTAAGGADHNLSSGSLTIPSGSLSRNITFTVTNDVLDENDETVIVTLGTPTNATLGPIGEQTIIIQDDDPPSIAQFSSITFSAEESTGTAIVTVTLSAASALTVTVDYATSDGTATANSDYTPISGTLIFAPDQTSQTFSVGIPDDLLDEPDETATLTLSSPDNATLGTPNPATLTIVDDDPPPAVQFSSSAFSVDENAGTALMSVTLGAPSALTVTVNYVTSDGTATANSDYTPISGTLIVVPDQMSRNFSVAITDDLLDEPDETATLTLSSPDNATLGTPNPTTLTIVDDDPPPAVQFSSSAFSVNESAGTVIITATLTAAPPQTVTVGYATGDGTTIAGSDYLTATGTLTFSPGVVTQTFDVSIMSDLLDEADETVILTLSNPVSVTLGVPNPATLTIADDDPPPTVQFTGSAFSVDENADTAIITITIGAPSGLTVTVNYTTNNGTALAGSDYLTATGALTFTTGVITQTFSVPIINDLLDETKETITLTLGTPSNAVPGTPQVATLTIVDDDLPPTAQFSSSAFKVDESMGMAIVTVTLSAASALTVTVDYATSDGTATANSDYTPISGTLIFVPGQMSRTFSVGITDDLLDEPDETVVLTLSSAVNASFGLLNPATLTIIDNDPPLHVLYLPFILR